MEHRVIKVIGAELSGRTCAVELLRWTSVDELLRTILSSSARPKSAEDPRVDRGSFVYARIGRRCTGQLRRIVHGP